MRVVVLALVGMVLALSAESASAQAIDTPPTARELATKFVKSSDNSSEAMLETARDSMTQALEAKGAKLPQNVKDWMTAAFAGASKQVMDDMTPALEQHLIDIYATNFTAEELQQVLDFQVYVRQPRIASVVDKASKEATSKARLEVMQAELPPEDFNKLMTFTLKPPMLNVTMLTLKETKAVLAEFSTRFQAALLPYCATAPKGVVMCEKQGRQP